MIGLHPEGKVLKTLPNHPLTTLRKIPVVEVGIMPKPTVGLEPTTYGLQNRCSIQLSYTGNVTIILYICNDCQVAVVGFEPTLERF